MLWPHVRSVFDPCPFSVVSSDEISKLISETGYPHYVAIKLIGTSGNEDRHENVKKKKTGKPNPFVVIIK